MNQAMAPPLLRRLALRLRAVVVAPRPSTAPRPRITRGGARSALGCFAAALLLLHLFAVFALDAAWPRLRDPEYGRRAESLRARLGENPGRPLVLVLGSSRTAMGVKPDAWEAARPGSPRDPLLFNMGLVGGGPVTELLALRRAYADGFRPAVVLVEYWAPLLRQDGEFAESALIDPRRLRWGDRALVRGYFPDPGATERRMWASRLNVLSDNREQLVAQAAPLWLVKPWRVDGAWARLDGWGWLPGMDPDPRDAATRRRLTEHQRPDCARRLGGLKFHPDSDRALREVVSLARAHGARVGFLHLPESPGFRSWYPPGVEEAGRAHLAALSRELGVPVIDARDWMDECYLADGFHLSRTGAALFTPRLGAALSTLIGDEP